MEVELVWRAVPFGVDFDHIVEITVLIGLELHVHLDRQTCSDRSSIFVLAMELGGAWLGEVDPPHVLGDVPDGHSDFIILVRLNV